MRVTFINPGYADESFWGDVDAFMHAVAQQFPIELTIRHGRRDPLEILRQGELAVSAEPPPDLLLLVNENNTGPRLLQLAERRHIPVQFILNDLTAEQRTNFLAQAREEQEWMPSLVPDNHWVGYHTAERLHQALRRLKPQASGFRWLAISGDETTPASLQREAGLRDYIDAQPDLQLLQVAHGEWREARATEVTAGLLDRFGAVDAIWTANDHMAFGVLGVLEQRGLHPGVDVVISTINSSPRVLDLLDQGQITALGAGHFTAGGWALIMAQDAFHGGAVHTSGTPVKAPLFELIDAGSPQAARLRGKAWSQIDFQRFSLRHTPAAAGYRFALP